MHKGSKAMVSIKFYSKMEDFNRERDLYRMALDNKLVPAMLAAEVGACRIALHFWRPFYFRKCAPHGPGQQACSRHAGGGEGCLHIFVSWADGGCFFFRSYERAGSGWVCVA